MLPTTKKIAMGRQIHVPVLHHRLPSYEILCAPHPIGVAEAPEKKKKIFYYYQHRQHEGRKCTNHHQAIYRIPNQIMGTSKYGVNPKIVQQHP